MATRDPSPTVQTIDALVHALSVESVVAEPAPMAVVMHMPRPHAVVRLLAVASVLMIAALTALMVWFAGAMRDLAVGIKDRQADDAKPLAIVLPAATELVDARGFAAALIAHPSEHARLYAARARAFSERGEWDVALSAFANAAQRSLAALPAADRIAWAEALWQRARFRDAESALMELGLGGLGDEDRAAAVELLGRCHLASRAGARISAAP